MTTWSVLLDIVLLLASALLLGILSERLKQNAVIGYLLTGLLLGPAVLDCLKNLDEIRTLSELGVALLLFTIGLEFSWRRLRELGSVALWGGTLQLVLTGVCAGLLAAAMGFRTTEAVVIGFAVSLSSTAVVLRVLTERAALDSLPGRNALGILLLQDLAVIPLLFMLTLMAEKSGGWQSLWPLAMNLVRGAALVAAMYLAGKYLLPRMLHAASAVGNRDLPIVLSVTFSLGGAWASHAVGLSPALGAFIAGMLIADTPFAQQARADVAPFRAAFVTLFFASVGTMVELPSLSGAARVAALALAIVLVKTLVVIVVIRLFAQPLRVAVTTGLVLAQIGEFSFVLAGYGHSRGLMEQNTFQLLLAASVTTLLLTPFLITIAPRVAELAAGFVEKLGVAVPKVAGERHPAEHARDRVVVVGFGPAGQRAVAVLSENRIPFLVIDLNLGTVDAFRSSIPIEFGDATRAEILEHAHLRWARALLVTIPDPHASGLIVSQARAFAPGLPVIVRSRYHIYSADLLKAGADHHVDEEELVGKQLGAEVIALLREHAGLLPSTSRGT